MQQKKLWQAWGTIVVFLAVTALLSFFVSRLFPSGKWLPPFWIGFAFLAVSVVFSLLRKKLPRIALISIVLNLCACGFFIGALRSANGGGEPPQAGFLGRLRGNPISVPVNARNAPLPRHCKRNGAEPAVRDDGRRCFLGRLRGNPIPVPVNARNAPLPRHCERSGAEPARPCFLGCLRGNPISVQVNARNAPLTRHCERSEAIPWVLLPYFRSGDCRGGYTAL